MKRLLLPLLFLLWSFVASAQKIPSDSKMEPTTCYALGNTWGFKTPTGPPVVSLKSGQQYVISGETGDWWIVRAPDGEEYLVTTTALVLDMGAPPPASILTNGYIYPPGREPAAPQPSNGYYDNAHDVYTGPRGGEHYINGNGNKIYITPQSTIDTQPVQTGPRGGQYYINDNGRKTYIKH